jgi:hypothetical protein
MEGVLPLCVVCSLWTLFASAVSVCPVALTPRTAPISRRHNGSRSRGFAGNICDGVCCRLQLYAVHVRDVVIDGDKGEPAGVAPCAAR